MSSGRADSDAAGPAHFFPTGLDEAAAETEEAAAGHARFRAMSPLPGVVVTT
jgi:hypothetical protein